MPQTNSDDEEIKKFTQFAQMWWDKKGPMAPLHHINDARMTWMTQKTNFDNQYILDVGCGGGILSEKLAEKTQKIDAIDITPRLIEVARSHAQNTNARHINYQVSSLKQWAGAHQNHYDIICCLEVIEHVNDPQHLLKLCHECLKPGGHLFVSTINRTVLSYLMAIIFAEYILGLLPKGTHEWSKFITPEEIKKWADEMGLSQVACSGMLYLPFISKTFWIYSLSVNYIMHLQRD